MTTFPKLLSVLWVVKAKWFVLQCAFKLRPATVENQSLQLIGQPTVRRWNPAFTEKKYEIDPKDLVVAAFVQDEKTKAIPQSIIVKVKSQAVL